MPPGQGWLVAVDHPARPGTDTNALVMQVVYLLAGGSILFLTLFRILVVPTGSAAPSRVQARR